MKSDDKKAEQPENPQPERVVAKSGSPQGYDRDANNQKPEPPKSQIISLGANAGKEVKE